MNIRGRNPSGVKLKSAIVFTIGGTNVKNAKYKYRFKINNAWYFDTNHNSIELAEQVAKRQAIRSEHDPGTIELISTTELC